MERDNSNLSTGHQPPGSARHPADKLDRDDHRGKTDSATAAIDDEGRPRTPGGPR